MIANQEQMVNKADSSAHGEAKINNNYLRSILLNPMLMKVDYAQKNVYNISYYAKMLFM